MNTAAKGRDRRPGTGRRPVLKAIAALSGAVVLTMTLPAFAFERSEAEWLTAIQNYLNLVRTVQADFLQVSSNGEFARGRVYIERPGRMRVEYDSPSPHLIVANNGLLIYIDRELGQRTHVPLSSTPAALLLAPSITLSGGEVKVIGFRARDGIAQLTLVQAENPGEGSLSLLFSDPPLTLKQWTVTDAQGISTSVELQNAVFDRPLPKTLFDADDPEKP